MKSCNLLRGLWRSLGVCVLAGMLSGWAQANNIRIIGKPVLEDKDTVNKTVMIKFDIAWDNSWMTTKPENHDAAWIFVKCWDGESWNHVYLEEDDMIAGSKDPAKAVNTGLVYYVSNRDASDTKMNMKLEPGYSFAWKKWKQVPTEDSVQCIVGYFLYRETYGAGHVVIPGVAFKWNYESQGFVDGDDLVVKVFAVEMVYVPKGAYYLGGKGTATRQTGSFTTNGNVFGTPMFIDSENAIKVENSADSKTLWAANNYMEAGTIPAGYPKGYNAFYIMKYEMTQEAYVEFLNSLGQGQQNNRINGDLNALGNGAFAWGSDISGFRNGIKIKQAAPTVIFAMDGNFNGKYNETDKVKYDDRDTLIRNIDGQDLAVNYVSMWDLWAYAEFSGLRPMTELEYEKACRGPREPANDEFAWGSAIMVFFYGLHHATYPWVDWRTGTERPRDAYNCGASVASTWWGTGTPHGGQAGPVRVGIFADSTTTRAASGASYWGVMNMSDNLAEMCMSAAWEVGRSFVGSHGSGRLDENGNAINKDWWDFSTNYKYVILRGMCFWNAWLGQSIDNWHTNSGMVSNRWNYNWTLATNNRSANGEYIRGIRCVRTEGAVR